MTSAAQSYASLWERVSSFAFDYLIIALYIVVLTAVGLVARLAFPHATSTLFGTPVSSQITVFVLLTSPVLLYFSLLESSPWQATWGKRRKGLKVTDARGERLTQTRALGRAALKFIPWELAHTCIWQIRFADQEPSPWITIGLVLVWVLVGANVVWLWISPRNQTLYDRLMGAVVIKG